MNYMALGDSDSTGISNIHKTFYLEWSINIPNKSIAEMNIWPLTHILCPVVFWHVMVAFGYDKRENVVIGM